MSIFIEICCQSSNLRNITYPTARPSRSSTARSYRTVRPSTARLDRKINEFSPRSIYPGRSPIGLQKRFIATGPLVIGYIAKLLTHAEDRVWVLHGRCKVAKPSEYVVKTGLYIDDIEVSKKTIQWPFQKATFINKEKKALIKNAKRLKDKECEKLQEIVSRFFPRRSPIGLQKRFIATGPTVEGLGAIVLTRFENTVWFLHGRCKAAKPYENVANPDFLIKFFKSVCSKENRWAIDEQVIFDKLFNKIEDLKTRKQLNTQQIGKIVTTGMRIFNTMPIDFQNKFFKFFLSTLDEPNVISQLEGDILHCAKLFTIAETPSNQENTAEAEKELLQIKDVDLRLEMMRRYEKTQGIFDKILANISIGQSGIIPKVISYLELRDQNLNKDAIQSGVCYGLTLLYCYYQFLGKESEFYDRIKKMLSIDIKQSEGLAEKRYDELSENEREFEHFCNDVLYLHGFPTRIQKPPCGSIEFCYRPGFNKKTLLSVPICLIFSL